MKFFIVTTFINALLFGSCCTFIWVSNFKSKTAQSFALFNSTVALWSFFYLLWILATQINEALFYSRCLNTIALFIPPSFLQFCINITNNKNSFTKKCLIIFICLDILILPFTFTKYFIPTVTPKLFFLFWPAAGPLFYFSIIQFITLCTIALFLLKIKLNQSKGTEKKQFGILFYSLLISFAGGSMNYLPCFNILITPYGTALLSCFIFCFMYLIFKYQIMDIRINLSRSFAYTILIFLITLLYFLATYLTNTYLNTLIGYKSFIFSFLTASITALAFIPLKNILQAFIDKHFFKKTIKEIEQENELLRQEMLQSDHMKSIAILASGMAHEIKNPLTPIKTFSQELPLRIDDKEFLLKFGRIICKEVERIDGLVQDLLNFAKPSAPQLKHISIHDEIRQTLDLLNSDIIGRKITLNYFLDQNDTLIFADPKQIKQAFLNIFLNAIDAMPAGGFLTVQTLLPHPNNDVPQNTLRITVADTGLGIKTKDIPYIYDPFFSKKDKGTGLGLSITYEIIKNHHGEISTKSSFGKGTTFTIELPF